MARVTRQSARRVSALASEATTPLSNASPVMSSRPQSVVTETPATSDVEDRVVAVKKRSASVPRRINKAGKRMAETDAEEDEDDESASEAPPAKRRAVSRRVYVSMPASTARSKEIRKVRIVPTDFEMVPLRIYSGHYLVFQRQRQSESLRNTRRL